MTPSGVSSDTERALARELDRLLRADALWDAFQSPPDDPDWRADMVSRALHLYEVTAPTFAGQLVNEEPAYWVAGLIRGVGDVCAALSRRWPVEQRNALGHGVRALLLDRIHARDLADWASGFGVDLDLTAEANGDREHGLESPIEDGAEVEEELAAQWPRILDSFRRVIDLRREDPDRESDSWPALADSACVLVANTGQMLTWAQERGDDEALFAVAGSLHLAAEGMFMATHQQTLATGLFPDDDTLFEFLEVSGAFDWLERHGVEVPSWLSRDSSSETG